MDGSKGSGPSAIVVIGGGFLALCAAAIIWGAAKDAAPSPSPLVAAPPPAAAPPAAPKPVAAREPLPLVGATALAKDYDANELAADAQWKGKRIRVAGIERRIERTLGTPQVTLGEALAGVVCSFPESAVADLAKLRKGRAAILEGTVTGAGPMGGVFLDDCRFPEAATLAPLYPDQLKLNKDGRVIPIGALVREPGFRN